MIRKRPRNDNIFSKATYDDKRPRFDPPSSARIEAARWLKDRAIAEQVTAVGGLTSWVLARFGFQPKQTPIIRRRV